MAAVTRCLDHLRLPWVALGASLLMLGCATDGTDDLPLSSASSEPTVLLIADPDVGYSLEPGEQGRLLVGIHCGVATLDTKLNGRVWRADEGAGMFDWIPEAWSEAAVVSDGPFVVDARLSDDGTSLTLTSSGQSVVYESSGTDFELEDVCD